MAKIIKKGNTIKKCPNCECLFEYDASDVKRGLYIEGGMFSYDVYWEYVRCPQCAKKIKIRIFY